MVSLSKSDGSHVCLHEVAVVSNVVLPGFEETVKVSDAVLLLHSDLVPELVKSMRHELFSGVA